MNTPNGFSQKRKKPAVTPLRGQNKNTTALILQKRIKSAIESYQKGKRNWVNLNNLELTEIPLAIFELPYLEFIDLSGNNLQSVPQRLIDMPQLQVVNLSGNPLTTLPEHYNFNLIIDATTYRRICNDKAMLNITVHVNAGTSEKDVEFLLKNAMQLRRLYIGQIGIAIGVEHPGPGKPIHTLLASLNLFDSLELLRIRGIRLNTVPTEICALPRLKHLALDALSLDTLPDWIGNLRLETLSAVDNNLHNLPDSFSQLQHLKNLEIDFNSFEKIPELIFGLTSLESLDFFHCEISAIPIDILQLHQLKYANFEDNPIESPPAEIAKEGLDAIRDYWRQRLNAGVDYLCEAKLVILGEAGAGKTSLAHKIENPNFKLDKSEKSTEGIDVIHYDFPTSIRVQEDGIQKILQRNFQVNIWDFGGQEIYHATHQFFLTRRSVYILVCDDRKEDTDFSYWLHIVEMLSDGSPLLIVQNEKQDRTRDINLSSLRARFGNLRKAISTNLDTNRGLDQVIQAIRQELENLPHVGTGLPATWKRVREALEIDQRDYISLDEYLDICQQHGFTQREDKLQLSGYLHDLGICLHFQDDPLLKNIIILKPSWGTDAVYRVLDDLEVINGYGQFTRKQLERIWSETKYTGMQDELLRLMMRFQLCYSIGNDQVFIAPQLLSSDYPPYLWEETNGLMVRYEYVFLPKGILTRFIVANHHLIAGGKIVWKTGVVLERDGTRAEIIEEYSQRRIRVRLCGADPHGLFAIVDEQLERLHGSFSKLKYERFLPCPCEECRCKDEPYGFALENLVKMARKGRAIQCHESGELVDAGCLVQEVLPSALVDKDWSSDPLTTRETLPHISSPYSLEPEVFVSYAWNPESCAIVDRLQEVLSKHNIRLLRDREEVRYKDSIRDFMRRIGKGKCVVVVISEKYLKSENCMFEMIEVTKSLGLKERIFPIVLSDANIYKATGRIQYVQHWEKEIRVLDEGLKTVRGDNLTKLQEDLNIYAEIRRLFDGIADTLRDMNALSTNQHEGTGFEELIQKIQEHLTL